MTEKFDVLYENALGRYQQGGYRNGDRVTFHPDALKHDFFKGKAQGFIDLVASCMEKAFDKIIRVSALKSIYPSQQMNYSGGTESPDAIYADVVIEGNPGFYTSPMTVPVDILVLHDDNGGRGPVPDSLKRHGKLNDPEEYETTRTDGKKDNNINYAEGNTKIAGGNKWDDKKPGGGNFKK